MLLLLLGLGFGHARSNCSPVENRSTSKTLRRWVVDLSPAHKGGDDDTPGSAAAVGTWLLRVRMGVRGVVTLASPAAQPEGVEEQEEEVQAQTEQRNSTEEQDRLGAKKKGIQDVHRYYWGGWFVHSLASIYFKAVFLSRWAVTRKKAR